MELRKRRQRSDFVEQHGVKIGLSCRSLRKLSSVHCNNFPWFNAEIQGDEILVKKYYDIGIAVSTDEGLVVPVVRDADRENVC